MMARVLVGAASNLIASLLAIGLIVLLGGCAHGQWTTSRERPGVTWRATP